MKVTSLFVFVVVSVSTAFPVLGNPADICTRFKTALAGERPFVEPLVNACLDRLNDGGSSDIWATKVCVAAAVAAGAGAVLDAASCKLERQIPPSTLEPLGLDVFDYIRFSSSRVVTKWDLVNFVYSEIKDAGLQTYPESADVLIAEYIYPMLDWAKAADGLSYGAFNMWLQKSGYTRHQRGRGGRLLLHFKTAFVVVSGVSKQVIRAMVSLLAAWGFLL
ncbi:hypothetical protein K488DRAFT_88373 [Vararia minispora EC-137]|uniref:Uncharacterized protein n=1 Tax=Vararia minispora EC-137 TaxID=1314806 RepID=A0ACB8QDT3_9AGAM|nr:hypothetical protein K488DRAFT_88373 [Vararia minispora EC-137]